MSDQKNYISQSGLESLQNEFNFLKKIERPKITKIVTWAASLGDRSENADYQYAKKRLREIDSRLRILTKRIHNACVVDYMIHSDELIRFGATVKVKNEEGEIKTFIICGDDESDSQKNRISWSSPIGKSLMGRTKGDELTVSTPSGKKCFEIINVNYLAWS